MANSKKYNKNSMKAYKKIGFVKTYIQVTDIGHGYIMDDYVMEKKLSLIYKQKDRLL